ncbi:unnamed protein product [Heligmosomoides polygyrus]|uniref:TAXi_C domain-containing protein n=1 Tax=Heligmosomoides polygyrus TaxID=6339 RepID=A0A3P8A3S5_HELPZ|nr:unnamed protein product [Heligmosomoides polygyrus]
MGSPTISRAAVPVKTAEGSPMHIIGLFKENFTIFDRHQRVTTGQGNCYVTEATDLLGLECRRLNESEKKYGQIEKEGLGSVSENAVSIITKRTISSRKLFAEEDPITIVSADHTNNSEHGEKLPHGRAIQPPPRG